MCVSKLYSLQVGFSVIVPTILPPLSISPTLSVVQLFNAVSQHCREVQAKVKAAGGSERKKAKGQSVLVDVVSDLMHDNILLTHSHTLSLEGQRRSRSGQF